MIRIIYLDIDGTLRDDARGVTPETARALRQCRENGIRIILCTGRNPSSIQPDVRRLSTDGLIAGGGCYIQLNGKKLFRRHFPLDTVEKAAALAFEDDLGLSLEAETSMYMNKSAADFYSRDYEKKLLDCSEPDLMRQNNCIRYTDNLNDWLLHPTPIHKICLVGRKDHVKNVSDCLKDSSRIVQLFPWNERSYLELLPPGCGKGTAVEKVNHKLKIDRSETICFGDGENDLDMFRASGIRVAVRGGSTKLIDCADSVCNPPTENGIVLELVKRGILPPGPPLQKGAH